MMVTLLDTCGSVSGAGNEVGMACLSRAALADGPGPLPCGLPARPRCPIAPPRRRGEERLMRRKAPGLGVPDEEPPARPGELKPAAERPSIGAARQREATGHRRSAVLPFAARTPIGAAGGRADGRREECPAWARRPAECRLVPPGRSLAGPPSLPPVEDEHDRALSLRRALVRDLERAPFRMGVRPLSPWALPDP